VAKERAPKEPMAEAPVAEERAPKQRVAKERAPKEPMAEAPVAEERAPKQRVTKERAPKERAPKERVVEERAPQEPAPTRTAIARAQIPRAEREPRSAPSEAATTTTEVYNPSGITSKVVHFDFDVDQPRPRFAHVLDRIAGALRAHPEIRRVRIEGHADEIGTEQYNQGLSERRARGG
jgi:outer membrane protein OmpA-like peptidoglycan-associated protein